MGKKKERSAIVFLNDQLKMAGEVLTETEQGRLVNMLRAYSMEGQLPDLAAEGPLFRSIFGMMRSAQDKAIAAYEETCERNRRNAKMRPQPVAATAATCSDGSQYSKNKSNQNESKQIGGSAGFSSFGDQETGVPGIGWL